jgi:hypothetical protein
MGLWIGATLAGCLTVAFAGAILLIVNAGRVRVPTDPPEVEMDLDELFLESHRDLVAEPDSPGSDDRAEQGHDSERVSLSGWPPRSLTDFDIDDIEDIDATAGWATSSSDAEQERRRAS